MPAEPRDIYTVTRLNREARAILEGSLPLIWVRGEISNLARPGSGHLYFTLKDEHSQVRCAMFKNRNRLLTFHPRDGQAVIAQARISLYEARGDFQLLVDTMEPAGAGALQQAFEKLKARLQDEGLFAAELKQTPPSFPGAIGVITSPTGAAVRDILTVLRRRYARAEVIVYPVSVQGEDAAAQIAAALETANRRRECDTLLLARGGGSLEDLWAFNEERVARAIHASELPVVTGIGHEIDFTIADFVADLRAPTPSAAAALITPDSRALLGRIDELATKLRRRMEQMHRAYSALLRQLRKRLPAPRRQWQGWAQRTDDLGIRLRQAMRKQLLRQRAAAEALGGRLRQRDPRWRLLGYRQGCESLFGRLRARMTASLQAQRRRLEHATRNLHTVSPLATLERGYAIVVDATGAVVRRAAMTRRGDTLRTRLQDGALESVVSRVIDNGGTK